MTKTTDANFEILMPNKNIKCNIRNKLQALIINKVFLF